MSEELKPCPFCGSEAEMLNYSENEWLVRCPACDGMVERWRETEAEAIEQWNRRANDCLDRILGETPEKGVASKRGNPAG